MTHKIPEEAVEAAARSMFANHPVSKGAFPWDTHPEGRIKQQFRSDARAALEAAALHLMPRTITTAEELDALPDDSLLIASGKTLQGDFTNCWIRPVPTFISGSSERRVWEVLIYFDGGYHNMTSAEAITFPATVLYEPQP